MKHREPALAALFATFEPLSAAEARLLRELGDGALIRFGDGRPRPREDPERTIRAAFLRTVIVHGAAALGLHEKGLQLAGAAIRGALDLEGCRIGRNLGLLDCAFDAVMVLRGAVVDSVGLDGSGVPGLVADRLEARGDLYLRGVAASGPVVLTGARIGGELVADGLEVTAGGELALDAERVKTAGSVLLRGAGLVGGLRLRGADVGADIAMTGAKVARPEGVAVDGDGLAARGDVVLRLARVEGDVALVGARVGGDVDVSGGRFVAPDGAALSLVRAVVEGALIARQGCRFEGAVNFNGARAGALVDDPAAWPEPGALLLNHFAYDAILGGPADAELRLRWLALQNPGRWGEDFWPHPYEQLSAVLADMGHDDDAQRVLLEKERLQRRVRRQRVASRPWRGLLALKDGLLYVTIGFGRLPLLAFAWLFALWLVGTGVYGALAEHDAFRPNVPVVLRSPEWVLCGTEAPAALFVPSLGTERAGLAAPGQSQLACYRAQPEAASFPPFNTWMYSLDVLLPAMEIGQQTHWSPDVRKPWGSAGRGFLYLPVIMGWVLSLLAVAGFSGIVKTR